MADAAAAPLPWPYADITLAAITHSLYRPPSLPPARAHPAGRGVTLRDQALFGTRMTKAGRGPKVEGSVKKASVPKAEGSAKKASVRKFQPRPCQVRADVGGPICHQHGGKWLRKTGTGAARRDVYSCGDPGCASEVSSAHAAANFMQLELRTTSSGTSGRASGPDRSSRRFIVRANAVKDRYSAACLVHGARRRVPCLHALAFALVAFTIPCSRRRPTFPPPVV